MKINVLNLKAIAIAIGLSMPVTMAADVYISETFANYIPAKFTLVNANSGEMQPGIYANMGNDPSVAWVAGQLNSGYGRAALAPTRNSNPSSPSDRWMILPAVTIAEPGAIVRWDARSLHGHIAETYRVDIRRSGGDWQTLYTCPGETYNYSTHYVSLDDYVGSEVQIAFVATTDRGFILAIDNVLVGVPDDNKHTFTSTTPHYAGNKGTISVGGTLAYYGAPSPWNHISLTVNDQEYAHADIPQLHCGKSFDIAFDLGAPTDGTYDYAIIAVDADGHETTIHRDFVAVSDYPRLQLIDRCSGTWCNNCPTMGLVTDKLKRYYGDELLVIEAHIRDVMANESYNTPYINDNVFAIPTLIPNRDVKLMTSTLKSTDYLRNKLESNTHMSVTGSATLGQDGEIRIHTDIVSDQYLDNSGDNIQIAYVLIGDLHDAGNPLFLQSSQALSYTAEQYYYMPEYILPEMMYYDNVPIVGDVYSGISMSLPAALQPGESYGYDYAMSVPTDFAATNLRVVAMVIDRTTQHVYNAMVTAIDDPMSIASITADNIPSSVYYDITGRPAMPGYRGIVISGDGKKIRIKQ